MQHALTTWQQSSNSERTLERSRACKRPREHCHASGFVGIASALSHAMRAIWTLSGQRRLGGGKKGISNEEALIYESPVTGNRVFRPSDKYALGLSQEKEQVEKMPLPLLPHLPFEETIMIPFCQRPEFKKAYEQLREKLENEGKLEPRVPGVPCPMAGVIEAHREEYLTRRER